MNIKFDRSLLSRKYFGIYLLYFFVFLAIGSLDRTTALLFDEIAGGAVFYGVLLSLFRVVDVFLPTIASLLSRKFGSGRVSSLSFFSAIFFAILLCITKSVVVWMACIAVIYSTRSLFNFSLGTDIILSVPNNKKGRFFAVRDLFLYSAISLSFVLAGLFSNQFSMKKVLVILTFFLLFPGVYSFRHSKIEQQEEKKDEKQNLELAELFHQGIQICEDKRFLIFLLVNILCGIYAATTAFYPFLAVSIGLDYQECLNSFAATSLIGAILAVLCGKIADSRNKKFFFILDIGFDAIPSLLFYFAGDESLFLIALFLTTFKDIFSPVTFAYKYEILGFENDNFQIAVLESLTSLFSLLAPVLVGVLWRLIGKRVFLYVIIAIIISVVLATFLPDSKVEPMHEE